MEAALFEPLEIVTKKCCTCKEYKEFSAFHKNKSRPDGLEPRCKACKSSFQKKSDNYKLYQKEYRKTDKYKSYKKNYMKNRESTDINFKLANRLRSGLRVRLYHSNIKVGSTVKDLGCSLEYFRQYIENQFSEDMNWENHGKVWDLDHVIPLSWFNLEDREEFRYAAYYLNYQPMYKLDNIKKGNKFSSIK